jgi:hypothetical protein
MVSIHSEGTLGRLRYFLGGDRPSQTAQLTLSMNVISIHVSTSAMKEWYPNSGSTHTGVHASLPPTYPVHSLPKYNISLQ